MGSTIAEAGLNFRVRNGNGCGPRSMDGGKTVASTPVPFGCALPPCFGAGAAEADDFNALDEKRSVRIPDL